MAIEVDDFSRFAETQTVVTDNTEVFSRWTMPNLLVRPLRDDEKRTLVITAAREGRPDLISFDLYRTTKLDWLIIALNRPNDTLNWPRAGDVIEVIDPSVAIGELL